MNCPAPWPTLANPQAYNATHSPITDPRRMRPLYRDLPPSLEALCRIVQGLVIHLSAGELYHYTIPAEELAEAETRDVAAILARIVERDPRPLTVARPPARRFVGH